MLFNLRTLLVFLLNSLLNQFRGSHELYVNERN